jgi:hypothetical protein
VFDDLLAQGASLETIRAHLAFVRAFEKIEEGGDEACEEEEFPEFSPLPEPSFDTLDVRTSYSRLITTHARSFT